MIYSDEISEHKTVLKRFEQNMETGEKQTKEFTYAIQCDQPFSVLYGIGNGLIYIYVTGVP
jgi:hypothetical protein